MRWKGAFYPRACAQPGSMHRCSPDPHRDDSDLVARGFALQVSIHQIVSYPSAIPVPGLRSSDDIVQHLVHYPSMQDGIALHGLARQGCIPSLRVRSAGQLRHPAALAATRPPRRRTD
jgi:hypothetical protein